MIKFTTGRRNLLHRKQFHSKLRIKIASQFVLSALMIHLCTNIRVMVEKHGDITSYWKKKMFCTENVLI